MFKIKRVIWLLFHIAFFYDIGAFIRCVLIFGFQDFLNGYRTKNG